MSRYFRAIRCAAAIALTASVVAACGGGGQATSAPATQAAGTRNLAFVVSGQSSSISGLRVDANNGKLSRVGTFVAGDRAPLAVAAHPSGRFAYVVNAGANNVSAYAVDTTLGTLRQIATSAAVGSSRVATAVRPDGRFACVAAAGASDVTVLAIDAATGRPSVVGTPVAVGDSPSALTIEPGGRCRPCSLEHHPGLCDRRRQRPPDPPAHRRYGHDPDLAGRRPFRYASLRRQPRRQRRLGLCDRARRGPAVAGDGAGFGGYVAGLRCDQLLGTRAVRGQPWIARCLELRHQRWNGPAFPMPDTRSSSRD